MFKLLWSTKKSVSFREEWLDPYIINQGTIDRYNDLTTEEKAEKEAPKPISITYKDYGVFDSKIINNQEAIDEDPEVEPKFTETNDFTNFFWSLSGEYSGESFDTACTEYLSSK